MEPKNWLVSLLRKSERYTKTDMVYLFKGGFWLTIGQIFTTGTVFLTSILFANLLDPNIFGIYKYILSINALFIISTISGMDSAVIRAVAQNKEGTLEIGKSTKMKWGVIGTAVALGVSIYYYYIGNVSVSLGFIIASLFIPFSESYDIYNSLLWGKKLFSVQTKYNILKKIISFAILAATILLSKNILIILLGYFVSITLPNVIFYKIVKSRYQTNSDIDESAITYGKHISAANIISLIAGELDKILVFNYLGAAHLAVYSLATAPTDQIKALFKNVNSLAMPSFASRSISDIKHNLKSKILIFAITVSIAVILYIVASPILFKYLFPKYLESVIFSQVLSLSLIAAVISSFLYTILEAQKATKELYMFNTYGNTLSIVLLFPLIYLYGIWGAIISRIISRIIVALISYILVKRL